MLFFDYLYVFWLSLIYVIFQGYMLHKNFVFQNKNNNFFKYVIVNCLFGLFDFFVSLTIKNYISLYSFAFICASIFTTILRFFIYKVYIFKPSK